jgi:hypothetical protein
MGRDRAAGRRLFVVPMICHLDVCAQVKRQLADLF